MKLKPTPPRDAVNRYLRHIETHVSDKTKYNYATTLRRLLEWCDENNIEDMNNLDSELIDQFKDHRLENVAPITCKNDMSTIRLFIDYAETIQAVPAGLSDLVKVPKINTEDEICDQYLPKQEADSILEYLSQYQYASNRHVTILLLWKTGMRLGGLRALDLRDFDKNRPAIEIRNRPEQNTKLKNGTNGERDAIISPDTRDVLADYIADQRPKTTDKYGRKPLVATKNGRVARTTVQKYVYTASRPCYYNGGTCPFDKHPDTCEYTKYDKANKCPGSVSPHSLRRGYVTAACNAGQPKDVTAERVNMTGDTLDKHYDKGTHDEKAERRRDHLREI